MEDIRELVAEYNDEALFADGFDEAIIGVVEKHNGYVACYDFDRCIEILMDEGMSEEEAVEHFDFNVAGSYVGENTPVYLHKLTEE